MITQISDVIVPEVYLKYTNERIAELSAIRQSGILRHDKRLDILAETGGSTIEMPYWKNLEGETQVLSDDPAFKIELNKITAGKETAVLLHRGTAWSASDLAAELSGDDPMREIIEQSAHFFALDDQVILLAILEGIFNSEGMEHATLDISGEPEPPEFKAAKTAKTKASQSVMLNQAKINDPHKMNAYAFINALKTLGDSRGRITAMLMHSHVVSHLEMLNLIQTIPDSRGETLINLYQRRRVIEDDGCPVESVSPEHDKFTTYLFGEGAIALGFGGTKKPIGFQRDELSASGHDILVHRRSLVMHPNGFTWKGKDNPSNDELRVGANWQRVHKEKNIPLIRIISNG